MTNPTPQDRELVKWILELSDVSCKLVDDGLAYNEECEKVAEYREAARLQGRREGLEEAAKALEADAQLCDCHAHDEGECACGAWCEWKTVPMHRAVEIVRTLYGAEPDKDGEG